MSLAFLVTSFLVRERLQDLFDNMYDLVDTLTFNLHRISTNMWPVFEHTYKLFKADAIDFLDGAHTIRPEIRNLMFDIIEMLPSLDNFISYGADVIKARPDYKMMILDIYTTAMTSDQLGENDRVNGCKLIESFLLNLRGEVNEVSEIRDGTTSEDVERSVIGTADNHQHRHRTARGCYHACPEARKPRGPHQCCSLQPVCSPAPYGNETGELYSRVL